jgi:hypothetical protein
VSLKGVRGPWRNEWDSLKRHDVVFLITLDMVGVDKQTLDADNDTDDASFPLRYGVRCVRGAAIIDVNYRFLFLLHVLYRLTLLLLLLLSFLLVLLLQNQVRDGDGRVYPEDADTGARIVPGDARQYTVSNRRNIKTQPRLLIKLVHQVEFDAAQYQRDSDAGVAERVYRQLNVVVRRKPKENNFKNVLEATRDLLRDTGSVPVWLHDALLGYGDPRAAAAGIDRADDDDEFGLSALGTRHRFLSTYCCCCCLTIFNFFCRWRYVGLFRYVHRCRSRDRIVSRAQSDVCRRALRTTTTTTDTEIQEKSNASGAAAALSPPIRAEQRHSNGNGLHTASNRRSSRFEAQHDSLRAVADRSGAPWHVSRPQHCRRSSWHRYVFLCFCSLTVCWFDDDICCLSRNVGKTDVAVQVVSNLYHSNPAERILLVTHSNTALNQLFDKLVTLDIDARHMLRLGHGAAQLDSDADYSRFGRVSYMLARRLALLVGYCVLWCVLESIRN